LTACSPSPNLRDRAEMKAIHTAYTQEVYANLRPLHATWEPTQPIRLGEVGILQGKSFRQQTHLQDLGIEVRQRLGSSRSSLWFGSNGTTNIQFKPAIAGAPGVVPVNASLELSFSSGGAVFFHAAKCTSTLISDKVSLKRDVLKRFQNSKWDPEWVVVTEAILAGSSTIAIAGQAGATLELEAQTSTPTVDLAEASLKFELRAVQRVGFQLISESGLTPLIGLSKLQRPLFSEAKFGPALAQGEQFEGEWDFTEIL